MTNIITFEQLKNECIDRNKRIYEIAQEEMAKDSGISIDEVRAFANKSLFNKSFTTLKKVKVKNNNMNVNKMNLRKKLFDASTKNFENKSLYASTKNDANKSLLNKSLTTFKKAKENIWKRYNIPSTKLFITQQDCDRINSKHLKKVKRIAGV